MVTNPLLIIDDEHNFRDFLGEALEAEGYAVHLAPTAGAGLAMAGRHSPRIVLLDQRLPDRTGLEILGELRRLPTNPAVIMITAHAEYPLAVDAMKAGAFHYLEKPFEFSVLLDLLHQAAGGLMDTTLLESGPLSELAGGSPQMLDIKHKVVKVARSPVPTVLIEGESGTGKELIAQAIHRQSPRAERALVAVNCAALTETLLMSELFGHERGAFTGAHQRSKGVFETAHGGTLFLDEISEIGAQAQAALLRVLEQRVITRVGATEEIPVDVRIIAASNRPLEQMVAQGQFRPDLFYRLNVIRLSLPPLRERGGDILLLARRFVEQLAGNYGEPARTFSPEAEVLLRTYPWPGNVRELRNVIERLYVFGSGPEVLPEDLPHSIQSGGTFPSSEPAATSTECDDLFDLPLQMAKQHLIDRFEHRYLAHRLAETGGNITKAAEDSGLLRQSFQRLVNRHNLDRREFRSY